jgi:hypothetical protein
MKMNFKQRLVVLEHYQASNRTNYQGVDYG